MSTAIPSVFAVHFLVTISVSHSILIASKPTVA